MKKALLLTSSYEFNAFVEDIRAIKLLIKDKVEVLAFWDNYYCYGSGKIKLPAIIKLVNPIKKFNYKISYNFNRNAIIKRDKGTCQYCGRALLQKEITIDHILPRSQGGNNTFMNCVVCCIKCNYLKGNKTPDQASMKLINQPYVPRYNMLHSPEDGSWHPEWNDYLKY